jgi:DNA-binding NarL/FixJ family response regulator
VEDDVRLRGNLARWIDSCEGFRCVSQHPNAETALTELGVIRPHVVLMDINLPKMSGVECTRLLKNSMPAVQIVMLTVYENSDHIFAALEAGASGYLLKKTPPEQLIEAIREVHSGGSPMSTDIARKVVASFRRESAVGKAEDMLSAREQEVLDHLVKGFLYKEIADALKISLDTVRTHVRHVYEKLHVRSRTEAVTKHLRQAGHNSPTTRSSSNP